MDRHPGIVIYRSLIFLALMYQSCCLAEKLSPDQKAPPFARGSGGLILKTPFESGPPEQPSDGNVVDGVEREETAMFKLVDGETVRVVEGHFAYKSPEGLPIFVKYIADENGNRASFKFGTGEGGSVQVGKPGRTPASTTGIDGTPRKGGPAGTGGSGQGSGNSNYLPPQKNVDRTYLPPQ